MHERQLISFLPNARDQCILQDIGPEVLHSKMQDPSFIEEAQLIDVREPDEV
jgi:hypothetical protein